jgi:flagellar biosynthetic protein FlhB
VAGRASEKTEAPTTRRLLEARKHGQVAISRDLGSATVFVAVLGALALGGGWLGTVAAYLRSALASATSPWAPARHGWRALHALADALVAPLLAATLAALAIGFAQTRGLLAPGAIAIDPGRIGLDWRRAFGRDALAEVGKGLLKLLLLGAVAALVLASLLAPLGNLAGRPPRVLLTVLAEACRSLTLQLALAAVGLGALDYLWQRHRHHLSLRMNRAEVERERRQTEGDPRRKAERQRLRRELLQQQTLARVRTAAFVVVSPEHIAVAVGYDRHGAAAPIVLAKGTGVLAARIKELAREAAVPLLHHVTLAGGLLLVEEGQEIPEALYEPVAEIVGALWRRS